MYCCIVCVVIYMMQQEEGKEEEEEEREGTPAFVQGEDVSAGGLRCVKKKRTHHARGADEVYGKTPSSSSPSEMSL
jgi:hypothetical protein